MDQDYKKLFTYLKPTALPPGLFDKIIFKIKFEQERRRSKKLLFSFMFLLAASLITLPISWSIFIFQAKSSGIYYFIATAIKDFNVFLALWQDFSLAILEALPITGIVAFMLSLGLTLFTLRLFLYKKQTIFKLLNIFPHFNLI